MPDGDVWVDSYSDARPTRRKRTMREVERDPDPVRCVSLVRIVGDVTQQDYRGIQIGDPFFRLAYILARSGMDNGEIMVFLNDIAREAKNLWG